VPGRGNKTGIMCWKTTSKKTRFIKFLVPRLGYTGREEKLISDRYIWEKKDDRVGVEEVLRKVECTSYYS
jgi:hypothetical protein